MVTLFSKEGKKHGDIPLKKVPDYDREVSPQLRDSPFICVVTLEHEGWYDG